MEILLVEPSTRDISLFVGTLESFRTESSLTVAVNGKAALGVVNKARLSDRLKIPDLIITAPNLPGILS